MALTNSKEIAVGSTQYGTWYLKLVLTETDYSIEDNTSEVKRQLYLRCDNTYSSISFDTRTAWIGTNKQTIAYSQSGASHLLIEDTVTVDHNNDGTGSFSSTFGISTSYTLSGSSSCSLTLTTIPRATTPTFSATSVELDKTITINTPGASDVFTHDLYYQIGNSATMKFVGDVSDSYSWTVPLSIANWLPSTTSGTLSVLCITYNGDTEIGRKTASFTVTIPSSIVPTISSLSISEATSGIASKFSAYIKNKSTLNVNITASSNYNSKIKNYKTTIDGATYTSSSFTSNTIRTSGALTITTTVTDTRDRTVTKTSQINVIDYYIPKITDFSVQRCDSSGNVADDDTAKYLLIAFGYDIAPVDNKNDKQAVLQYYNESNNSWTDIETFTDVYKREFSNYKTTIEFDIDKHYEVRLVLTDYFNTSDNAITISRSVDSTYTLVNYHSSGNGMAIGTVSSEEDTFEVGLSKTILKDSQINGSLKVAEKATLEKGTVNKRLNSGSGTSGYMYVFSLNMANATYQNQYFTFDVLQRSRYGTIRLLFSSSGTTGTCTLSKIITTGNIIVAYVNASNTFDLYIQKSEAYDDISIHNLSVGDYMTSVASNFTWKNQTVSSLPSGAKTITPNQDIYPIGSIYMSVNSTSPATLFGGTWEQLQGRFLIGVGTTTDARGDTVTATNGLTGGERQHVLTVDEMPSHNHTFNKEYSQEIVAMKNANGAGDGWDVYVGNSSTGNKYRRVMSVYGINNTGGGKPHNNMPPYLAVYMWKRTG